MVREVLSSKLGLILFCDIGIEHVVVFLNKTDVADPEMIELAEMEVRDVMNEVGYKGDDAAIIAGSALCALEDQNPEIGRDAVLKLLDTIDEKIPEPLREVDKPFMMPVEKTYYIAGRGTVITGKVLHGKVKKGDEVQILGYEKEFKTNVVGMETFHQTLEEAVAGDSVGLLIKNIKREDLKRGMVAAAPNTLEMHDNVLAKAYILTADEGGMGKPILHRMRAILFTLLADIRFVVDLMDKDMVLPGEDVTIKIGLGKKLVLRQGQRFTFRALGHTLGTGVITEVLPDFTLKERTVHKMGRTKKERAKFAEKYSDVMAQYGSKVPELG